jgi:hypothetical protein
MMSNDPLSTSCDLPIAMVIILNPALTRGIYMDLKLA